MREYERMMDEAGGSLALAIIHLLDSVDGQYCEPNKRRISFKKEEPCMIHAKEINVR